MAVKSSPIIRYPNFGANLQKWRMVRGMSQEALAKAIGASRTAVTQWEIGRNAAPFQVIDKVAVVLNVKLYDLLANPEDFREPQPWVSP